MSRLELSEGQRSELEACFRTTEDRRLRDRCQAVLMTARSRPQQQIAEDLGTTPRNVQRFAMCSVSWLATALAAWKG